MESRSLPVTLLVLSTLLAVVLLGVLSVVGHDDPESGVDAALLEELRDGGEVLLFRHAITDRSISDLDPTSRGGCDQQRPLSEEGREQAAHIGQRLRALDIPFGPALASPFCRTMETATLIAGTATPSEDLLSLTAALDATQAAATTAAGQALVTGLAGGPEVGVLVTHTQNIEALTGRTPEEGDAIVLGLVDGQVSVLGVVAAADW